MDLNDSNAVTQRYGDEETPWGAPSAATGGGLVRVTERRLEVLRVVWQQPGLSNRAIGQAATVGQAQISRMLRRLAELGLVKNTGGGRPLGMANCWHLTAAGRALLEGFGGS